MFKLENSTIMVQLPEGKTQKELVEEGKEQIRSLIPLMYSLNIKINGRITTGMALMIGHELAHICKSVSIFDPKENDYITCISH